MRFGLQLPQLGRGASPDLLVEVAQRADELGFADLWVADHVAVPTALEGMPAFFPEPIPLLSAAAAHTARARLGTSVLVPAYRNPMHFAKQWATLDWLSGGRTILGVGAGWLEAEFRACGVEMADRGGRLDDYIRGWRAAWSGETDYTSEHFSFAGVRVKPEPAAPVPIWVGGSSDGALRRAAWCDGWMGTWAPVEVFAERLAALRRAQARCERPPDAVTASIHMEVRVGTALDADSRWARVGDGYADREMAIGSVDAIAELVATYEEAGLEHVLLVPLARSAEEWGDHVEALAELLP